MYDRSIYPKSCNILMIRYFHDRYFVHILTPNSSRFQSGIPV